MLLLRTLFILVGITIGGLLGHLGSSGVHPTLRLQSILGGCVFGGIVTIIVVAFEARLKRVGLKTMLGATIGMMVTLVMANLVTFSLASLALAPSTGNKVLILFVNISAAYLGAVIGARIIQDLDLSVLSKIFKGQSDYGLYPKVLDTSVIIDGRIAEVSEAGFLEGVLIIPTFVLREIHHIADSGDEVKKSRGRRGLDVVQRLQKNTELEVKIVEEDFPKIREVDLKLIALSQKINGKIVTNDYNLAKIAELQNINVLNINQLASATKPMVLPGEEMASMLVVKEGKEQNQGVAYLDDGTMVVIDHARKRIGQKVNIVVTSVLQTPTGRMIFAKINLESPVSAISN